MMNRMRYLLLIVISATIFHGRAQVPSPGKLGAKPVLIMGATLHIGNGKVVKDASLAIVNGRIVSADSLLILNDFKGYTIVEAKGKHLYPGLIAPNSTLGLNEIDAVRSTRDFNEVGTNNANVRSLIAYNTDSKVIPTVRSNGILLTQVTPQGGLISGTSGIVQLDAWNWEDAAIKMDDALHVNWPRMSVQRGWWAEPGEIEKLQVDKELFALEEIFSKAKSYSETQPEVLNLKLEAFKKVFTGATKIFVHADGAKEMMSAIEFFKKYGITPTIVGANESFLISAYLKLNKVPVILLRTHNLPSMPEDDIDLPYKLPKLLQDSGVLYCIADVGSWQQRNLPFQAGSAVAYGLTDEQALMAITKNTAEILGIAKDYGTLEPGKSATLFLSEGNVLDMKTSVVTHAWIDGRPVDLDNHQKQLNIKFRKKYFSED